MDPKSQNVIRKAQFIADLNRDKTEVSVIKQNSSNAMVILRANETSATKFNGQASIRTVEEGRNNRIRNLDPSEGTQVRRGTYEILTKSIDGNIETGAWEGNIIDESSGDRMKEYSQPKQPVFLRA